MTHHARIIAASADPAEDIATTVHPVTRHDGWTRPRQVTFLRELSATHCVTRAARAAGMSRQSAYALRARLKGEPFDRAWHAAMICRFDALAEAAMERALNGVEVPHFYNGELVGTSRRYDERLTVALLAMRAGFAGRDADPCSRAPSGRYGDEEFGALLDRVEHGPETWQEERDDELAEDERQAALPDAQDTADAPASAD